MKSKDFVLGTCGHKQVVRVLHSRYIEFLTTKINILIKKSEN